MFRLIVSIYLINLSIKIFVTKTFMIGKFGFIYEVYKDNQAIIISFVFLTVGLFIIIQDIIKNKNKLIRLFLKKRIISLISMLMILICTLQPLLYFYIPLFYFSRTMIFILTFIVLVYNAFLLEYYEQE